MLLLSVFTLRGQIGARTCCCEVVENCDVQFPTSSPLGSSVGRYHRLCTMVNTVKKYRGTW